MANKVKRSLSEVLKAIEGSGGIKQTIANRLNVTRQTVDNYLNRWATAHKAYEQECQANLDIAESIIITNMELQRQRQLEEQEEVSTSDARWYMTMKGGEREYAERKKFEVSINDLDATIERELAELANRRQDTTPQED